MDGRTDKEKMIYFLEDVQNYKINEIELMQKNWKELEHVMFMFRKKNSVCKMMEKKNGSYCCITEEVHTSQQRI